MEGPAICGPGRRDVEQPEVTGVVFRVRQDQGHDRLVHRDVDTEEEADDDRVCDHPGPGGGEDRDQRADRDSGRGDDHEDLSAAESVGERTGHEG